MEIIRTPEGLRYDELSIFSKKSQQIGQSLTGEMISRHRREIEGLSLSMEIARASGIDDEKIFPDVYELGEWGGFIKTKYEGFRAFYSNLRQPSLPSIFVDMRGGSVEHTPEGESTVWSPQIGIENRMSINDFQVFWEHLTYLDQDFQTDLKQIVLPVPTFDLTLFQDDKELPEKVKRSNRFVVEWSRFLIGNEKDRVSSLYSRFEGDGENIPLLEARVDTRKGLVGIEGILDVANKNYWSIIKEVLMYFPSLVQAKRDYLVLFSGENEDQVKTQKVKFN